MEYVALNTVEPLASHVPDVAPLDIEQIDARVRALEAEIIEQEHRPFNVLKRFFLDRQQWPPGDPRRAASARAMIWSAFFSPASFAIGGTLVGFFSIAILIWQNLLIQDQTLRADRLGVEERRSTAIRLIYEDQYAKHPAIRAQALRELAALSVEGAQNERLSVDRAYFRAAGFGQDETLGFDAGQRQSDEVVAAQFYRRLHGVHLTGADLKRISITNLNLDYATFVSSDLSHAVLQFASLRGARFVDRTNLENATIGFSVLTGASLAQACAPGLDLSGSDLSETDFTGADIRGVRLHDVINWKSAKFVRTLLTDVRDAPTGFLEFAKAQGAVLDLPSDQAISAGMPCGRPLQRNHAR